MKQKDFIPSKGAYNANKYPAMFEFRVPYQVKMETGSAGIYLDKLTVNIEDVGKSFDYHFGEVSNKMLKEFMEALIDEITPEQVEKALKRIAHRAL